MRRFFLISILICLIFCLITINRAIAGGVLLMGGGVAAAAPPSYTYIYGGSSTYVDNTTISVGYPIGAEITPTAVTVKVIGVYIQSVGDSTACKAGLNLESDGSLKTQGSTSSLTTGWNDITVTEYLTSNVNYKVLATCNGTTTTWGRNSDSTGIYCFASYAASMTDPSAGCSSSASHYMVRLGY